MSIPIYRYFFNSIATTLLTVICTVFVTAFAAYALSKKEFAAKEFVPFLDAYIKAYGENEYYELVLKIIAHLSRSQLKAIEVSDLDWYEIDDAQDLDIANCMFSHGKERLEQFEQDKKNYYGEFSWFEV